jgi:hypothetical protein
MTKIIVPRVEVREMAQALGLLLPHLPQEMDPTDWKWTSKQISRVQKALSVPKAKARDLVVRTMLGADFISKYRDELLGLGVISYNEETGIVEFSTMIVSVLARGHANEHGLDATALFAALRSLLAYAASEKGEEKKSGKNEKG